MAEGILDKISKMVNIKSAVDAGRQREEAAQRSELKFMVDQQRAQDKIELDNLKYTTNRYTDLYFKAKGNTALQGNILSTMQGMKQSLPPAFRQQFDAFTSAGPFSEIAEKGRKFTELYGNAPRALTDEESKDHMTKGKHVFAVSDYNQKREHFLTGKAPGKKRRFVPVGDGSVLGRTDDDFFYQTTEEALAIQAISKDFGVNPGKLLADDGFIFGTPRKGSFGGRRMTATPYKDVMGNSADGEDVVFGDQTGGGKKPAYQTQTLKSFLINFMGESTGSSEGAMLSRSIKDLMKESGITPLTRAEMTKPPSTKKRKRELAELNNIITTRLKTIPEFRNLNFKVFDPDFDEHDWFSTWGASDKATIMAIPGKPQKVTTSDGYRQTLYNYQGEAYDGRGQHLGGWNDVAQMINTSTKEDLMKR